MPLRLRTLSATQAKSSVLRRRLLEERSLPPSVRERIRQVFGEDLSAEQVVRDILDQVRTDGDKALYRLACQIEGVELAALEVPCSTVLKAVHDVDDDLRQALELAAHRVRSFHSQNLPSSWLDPTGTVGQLIRPLARAGIYAPGGRAVYPSTVLMTAIPARCAGVEEVILCSPAGGDGRVNPSLLAAAAIGGVDRVFCLGGAAAIGAMAYGTESVPRVDKILGPGNIFVTLAKRLVFGSVGIDQLAGPTETLIVADQSASPGAVAADMLAQCEHDPLATAILISTSVPLVEHVIWEIERQAKALTTGSVALEALSANGAIILAESLDEAIDLANLYAPEHLCLLVGEPWSLIGKIRHAGGVFLGEHSPEVLGDYVAGPSHVMPTGGSARYASPITVLDFIKITSLVGLTHSEAAKLAPTAATIAAAEGLPAHAQAARLRAEKSQEI